MQKLVGDDIPLTQEFLAQMMGVRRTSVTEVAGGLQRAGMIAYSRGRIKILDIELVQRTACECDAAVNAHYAAFSDDRVAFPVSVDWRADGGSNPR